MSCGSGNLEGVIRDIIRDRAVNEKALTAALEYVATQIDPVKKEISKQTVSIVIVTIWAIAFTIIFILIVFIFWICYELNVRTWLIALVIFCIIVVVLVAAYTAVLASATTIDTIVQKSLNELTPLDNIQTRNIIVNTLNTASSQYLEAVKTPCSLA
jgi:glucan phosphoethanolaminetransferase (alkaline phosphatase superfamily)